MDILTGPYVESLRYKSNAESYEIAYGVVADNLGVKSDVIFDAPASKYRSQIQEAVVLVSDTIRAAQNGESPYVIPAMDGQEEYEVAGIKLREPTGRELVKTASSETMRMFNLAVLCSGQSEAKVKRWNLDVYLACEQFLLQAYAG